MNQSQINYQLELVIDAKLLEQQDKIIRDGIVNFNAPFTGTNFNAPFTGTKPERYSIYVKDNEDIIGGAIVYAHKSSVYVDVLWVKEEYRGLGIGAQLLCSVESN